MVAVMEGAAETDAENEGEMDPVWVTDWVPEMVLVTVEDGDLVPVVEGVWDWDLVEEAVMVVEREVEIELVKVADKVDGADAEADKVAGEVIEGVTAGGAVPDGVPNGVPIGLEATAPEERAACDKELLPELVRDTEIEAEVVYDPELVRELLRESDTEPEVVALMVLDIVAAAVVAALEEGAKRANKATIKMTNLYIIELYIFK
jgi:hypothetical protein